VALLTNKVIVASPKPLQLTSVLLELTDRLQGGATDDKAQTASMSAPGVEPEHVPGTSVISTALNVN